VKIQDYFAVLLEVLLAVFGALAKQLHIKEKKKLKLSALFRNCFIGGFIGIVIYFITVGLEMNGSLSFAAAGICGWLGPKVLDDLADFIKARIGLKDSSANDEAK